MAQLVLGSLRSENWYTEADYPWLPAGGVIADCLMDLRINEGTLSVYEIEDAATDDLVQRIVAAIAAGRESPRDVAYFRFERAAVEALHIAVDPNERGTTGDETVNALHRNLVQLSAMKIGELAGVIAHGVAGELTEKQVRDRIRREVIDKNLSVAGVNSKLRSKLGLS